MQTLRPALRSVIDQLREAKSDWQRHWDSRVVHLATAIAERIIRRELQQQAEIGREWIEQALELVSPAAEVVLRLHPQDCENLGEQVKLLHESVSPTAKLEVLADEAISPGGCRVETRFGSVDNQLETQLARIEEELTR